MSELPYTALITAEELSSALLREGLADVVKSSLAEVERLIADVTDVIEGYLGRGLIIRPCTRRLRACDWQQQETYENADRTPLYLAWPAAWPVVEVVSVDGVAGSEGVSIIDDGRRLAYDPDVLGEAPRVVVAFCGYRRRDQTVADLQAAEDDAGAAPLAGLSDTAVVPVLPGRFRAVALTITMAAARQRAEGMVGRRQKQVSVGQAQLTIDAVDAALLDRELARLDGDRRLSA